MHRGAEMTKEIKTKDGRDFRFTESKHFIRPCTKECHICGGKGLYEKRSFFFFKKTKICPESLKFRPVTLSGFS